MFNGKHLGELELGMVHLSVITRSISLQMVHLVFLWARFIDHGQEIGLLDDTSCHLALIPSGYSSLGTHVEVSLPQDLPTYSNLKCTCLLY